MATVKLIAGVGLFKIVLNMCLDAYCGRYLCCFVFCRTDMVTVCHVALKKGCYDETFMMVERGTKGGVLIYVQCCRFRAYNFKALHPDS